MSNASTIATEVDQLLQRLGVPRSAYQGGDLTVGSPLSGLPIAAVTQTTPQEATTAIARAHAAYLAWRNVPAPRRGELVRLLGEELRAAKADLGLLVTLSLVVLATNKPADQPVDWDKARALHEKEVKHEMLSYYSKYS